MKEQNDTQERLIRQVEMDMASAGITLTEDDKLQIRRGVERQGNMKRITDHIIRKHMAQASRAPLTADEIRWLLDGHEKLYIVRNGKNGHWETVDGVYAWMDIEDLALENGKSLPLEQYGETWLAYWQEPEKHKHE